ncbi:MAG: hypothetical protein GY756_26920 [bacterium]|nr:hypothetical protein [bacterium]
MVLSPVINGTLPTTNDSEEISEPCTSPVPTDSERVITFTSMRTDVDGEEDFDYWDAVDCLTGDYTYGFIDCDGNLILNKDYATSLTVGFPAIGKVKAIWDATNARKWEGELKWKETCTNAVRRIILTDAVKAAIGL